MDGGEVCIIGDFQSEWTQAKKKTTKPAAPKVKAIEEKRWEPDKDDYTLAATQGGCKNPVVVKNVTELMGAILGKKKEPFGKRSVTRINIIAHSNPEQIALAGDVVGNNVDWGNKPPDSFIQEDTAEEMERRTVTFRGDRKNAKYSLADVRDRIAANAKLYIYSCRAGVTKAGSPATAFLGPLAKALGVDIVAPKGFVGLKYFWNADRVVKDLRMWVVDPDGAKEPDDANKVSDFHDLDKRFAPLFNKIPH
jgi:hypothetical protein